MRAALLTLLLSLFFGASSWAMLPRSNVGGKAFLPPAPTEPTPVSFSRSDPLCPAFEHCLAYRAFLRDFLDEKPQPPQTAALITGNIQKIESTILALQQVSRGEKAIEDLLDYLLNGIFLALQTQKELYDEVLLRRGHFGKPLARIKEDTVEEFSPLFFLIRTVFDGADPAKLSERCNILLRCAWPLWPFLNHRTEDLPDLDEFLPYTIYETSTGAYAHKENEGNGPCPLLLFQAYTTKEGASLGKGGRKFAVGPLPSLELWGQGEHASFVPGATSAELSHPKGESRRRHKKRAKKHSKKSEKGQTCQAAPAPLPQEEEALDPGETTPSDEPEAAPMPPPPVPVPVPVPALVPMPEVPPVEEERSWHDFEGRLFGHPKAAKITYEEVVHFCERHGALVPPSRNRGSHRVVTTRAGAFITSLFVPHGTQERFYGPHVLAHLRNLFAELGWIRPPELSAAPT